LEAANSLESFTLRSNAASTQVAAKGGGNQLDSLQAANILESWQQLKHIILPSNAASTQVAALGEATSWIACRQPTA